jgi:HNH endonuclease/Domain of unknown function (DUF222)
VAKRSWPGCTTDEFLVTGGLYVWIMELGSYSEDRLDQLIAGGERQIATIRLVQMAAVAEKRRRKTHLADGYRSIVDWTAARADVSHETARSLCWTASRLRDAPEVAEALATGALSFDRAQLLARLPEEHRSDHEGFDIGRLKRLVAHHKRLTRKREKRAGNGFVHFGSDTELIRSFWGKLPGLDARIMEKAVDQKADEIIPVEERMSVAERRALALVAICQDSLYQTGSSQDSPPTELAVIVDARTAAKTGGETGVSVLAGPRIGPGALEEILCNGVVDVVGITEEGKPLSLGKRSRTVSPKMRRHVLHRDGKCTVDSCPFNYRLEVHHVRPRGWGGDHDPDNLITLCWYHHHVSVHREGLQIIRLGASRVRLKRPR